MYSDETIFSVPIQSVTKKQSVFLSSLLSACVYVTGGSETTEDAPYLLTDAFLSQTCTVHNEFNSTYTGTNSFPGSTGVNPIGADPAGDASTPDASTTTTDPAATTDQSVDGQ